MAFIPPAEGRIAVARDHEIPAQDAVLDRPGGGDGGGEPVVPSEQFRGGSDRDELQRGGRDEEPRGVVTEQGVTPIQ